MIGFSVNSLFYTAAQHITKEIKKEMDIPIIWGGIHPTICAEESIKIADMICVGEGEESFLELCNRMETRQGIQNIPGIWIRKNEQIYKNSISPVIADLDKLPFPDFTEEDEYYIGETDLFDIDEHKIRYRIFTSRWCFFTCSYCYNSVLRRMHSGKKNYVRRRSAENVIEELVLVKKRFPILKQVNFNDDIFTFDDDWIREFSKKYKEQVSLPFECYPHPKLINDENIKLLSECGLKMMKIGLQSGSESYRRKYLHRLEKNKDFLNCAHIMHKYNIEAYYFFFREACFETDEDRYKTLDLLLKFPKPFSYGIFNLLYFPKFPITERALEEGEIKEQDIVITTPHYKFAFLFNKKYLWENLSGKNCSKRDLFWLNLYLLTGRKFVPNTLIRFLSKNSFIKRYPKALSYIIYVAFISKLMTLHLLSLVILARKTNREKNAVR